MKDLENTSKVDVLIVDDKLDNLTVLEAVLGNPQYNLVKATSGNEAVALAAVNEFAAILLDVQMPIMDGFEAARRIRRDGASKRTPIIFITAIYADESYVSQGYDVGAVDYIFKPINPDILVAKVAVFADIFQKNKQILHQAEMLREVERRESRRVLFEAQQMLSSVIRRAPIIVFALDKRGVFTGVQGRGLEPLGLVPESVEGQSSFEICKRFPDALRILRDVLKGNEANFVVQDKEIYFDIFLIPQKSEDGQIIGAIGIARDVTEQKRAELGQRFLAEAGAFLANSLDYKATLSSIARLAVPRFGTWCIVHAQDESGVLKLIETIRAPGQEPLTLKGNEVFGISDVMKSGASRRGSTTNGSARVHFYISVPLRVREKTLGTMTLVSADRSYSESDRHLFEELGLRVGMAIDNAKLLSEREKAVHLRDEFLSIASHELRTPLTTLKMQFQSMTRLFRSGNFEKLDAARVEKMLNRSDRQLDRLSRHIDDLLNVSRIRLGRMVVEPQRTEMSSLVKGVVEHFQEELANSNCKLTVNLEENLWGNWDPFKLEQVVVNLLTNAIKYGYGKPISIELTRQGDKARLVLEDHGIGILEKDQDKIFDLFERAAPSRHYGGLGLGLYIAKNIVEQHQGNILVESQPGLGARFTVNLPLNLRKPVAPREAMASVH